MTSLWSYFFEAEPAGTVLVALLLAACLPYFAAEVADMAVEWRAILRQLRGKR